MAEPLVRVSNVHKFFTRGKVGRFGFTYAQCSAYGAPCAIQRWMTRTSCGVSVRPDPGGGMRRAGSRAETRWYIRLASGLPGVIAR